MIENGEIVLNGSVECRKRAKIRKGDTVKVEGQLITIY
jgi:ribosome-associated protein